MSLSRNHRLTDSRDYQLCYNGGRKVYSSNFVLFVRQRENDEEPWRLGLAVTKKVGCAVRRNRLRRLIREAARQNSEHMPMGYDFVVVPKKHIQIPACTFHTVSAELVPLFKPLSRSKNVKGSI